MLLFVKFDEFFIAARSSRQEIYVGTVWRIRVNLWDCVSDE